MIKREIKHEGEKYIVLVSFKCDKCGNVEKYRQIRGGFVAYPGNSELENQDFGAGQKVKIQEQDKKQEIKTKILWFNAERIFKRSE